MNTRYICIHGHFYQPPRENPWLNEIELQESAHPYHDWNERITEECYSRNAASRILGPKGEIADLLNNYARISFNFGPTLLSWMERKAPETYAGILQADQESMKRFSGHGAALAQVYNHIIMPLANARDKQTQVLWGIYDFQKRFNRKPEGMWLAETAVDTPTLEVLAANGIAFTILSPYQARGFRRIGERQWFDATGAHIDPRQPYRCNLPSGNSIVLFFYDGPASQGVAFERLLNSGEGFANRLAGNFTPYTSEPQLMHIATDGESYGHHHRFGEMALTYALHHIEREKLARLTIYGEYLAMFPPVYEAQIIENSSWSCAHGVERWRSDCGCHTGGKEGWNQRWRAPLREAYDWLRDQLIPLYEREMSALGITDPWLVRDAYISVIMDRSEANVQAFIKHHTSGNLSKTEQTKFLQLLEMQYHTLLMYTSCGWFFDEVTGIETVQDLLYAARALQLAESISGQQLEVDFLQILQKAKSNIPEEADAAQTYRLKVKPMMIDLLRVGAHFGITSLFTDDPEELKLQSFKPTLEKYELRTAGKQKMAIGHATIKSLVTWEELTVTFGMLHLGDHQLFGGVREFISEEAYEALSVELTTAFDRGNINEVIMLLDKHFESHNYSFWHLFKDDQRKILDEVLARAMHNVENSFQQIYENNYPLMAAMKTLSIKLPRPLHLTLSYITNLKLQRELAAKKPSILKLNRILDEVNRMDVKLITKMHNYEATRLIDRLMLQLSEKPDSITQMNLLTELLPLLARLKLKPDIWHAQNLAFRLKQSTYNQRNAARANWPEAEVWCKKFEQLYESLQLKI
ncbi:DUF3536 domain-containing protein [Pontibacter arcticus]|uniref:Glycoside hydrolase n=1 Tax=Pontibacter arcticus TaxID=2080288 RepID=A0A364REV0_9BACT|nr:DUF3536 domain-containing protein [Pontibacter arcticus]RAU82696.1 glycoside hydrolase [Pontibacter arcticus]